MKRLLSILFTTCFFLAWATPVSAQEFRVGFVTLDKILRESNFAKAAQAKLEKDFGSREKELVALGDALKVSAEKFDREAPTMQASARLERQKKLAEDDREFQRKRSAYQEDLNARKNDELQSVLERATRVVKQVAETEKYDLILQEAVYINPKHDITDKVIKALNAQR